MANPTATAADGGAPPAAARSPLPLKEAAAWNLTERSIRETKLREALVALDSDRARQQPQPSASASAAHAAASDTNNMNNCGDSGSDDERKLNARDDRELNADEVDDIIAAARGILGQTLERIDPYLKRPAAARDHSNTANKANILFDPESRSIGGTLDANTVNHVGDEDNIDDEHDEIGTLDRFGVKSVGDDGNNNDEDCGMSLPSAINDSGSLHSTTVEHADGITFADNVEHHRAVVMGSCPPSAENSVVGVGGGFGAGKIATSSIAANEGIKSSIFFGKLPPRPVSAGANQHVGGVDVGHHTAADAGSSCGSSIATTDLHSLRGGGGLLRIPPSRLPPGSQMDHSLATTVSNHHADAMSVPRSEGTGVENESLAWKAALQDGPGRIRTTVEQEAPPVGHSSGATIASTASSPVSTILSHNRTLQARAANDAIRMEEMAVAEAEAREELALLRAQLQQQQQQQQQQQNHHQYQGKSLTLQELRGEILHRTREELAAASGEVVRLRTELEEARSETETCQAALSVENSALRDEIYKLSSTSGVGDGGDSAGMGPVDSNLFRRATAAEATAAELRRQLEATKDTAEREAERAARSEREREALKEEVELTTKRLAAARDEVREVRRDRDGLRGELTELLRAKKNPERTADKEFGAEVERLRRLANQAKEDTEKKEKEMGQLQLQHEKDVKVVRNGEAIALRDAEKLKRGLKTLVDQLRSLERAGELGNISVNQILITSQGNLSSSLTSMLMDDVSATERKVIMSEKSTQATTSRSEKEEAIMESIGINTTVTSSFAANLFSEGLQNKADLRDAELRLSQLQLENTDLQEKCDRMNCQLIRLEEEKREDSAAISAKMKEEDVHVRQLSLLCEELKTKSAQLEQDNASLTEKQSYIDDQNRVLVRRAVELEELVDEAQGDVERLTNELNSVKSAAEDVKDLEDDKARMQAEWEEARRECELLQQELLDASEKAGRYQEEEKELQSKIGTLSSENIALSERLQTALKDLEAQRNENSTLGKSKLDYEWRCTNLGEEVSVLKEKLEFYQSNVDAREDKYNTLAAEKLGLEKEVNECRGKIASLSLVRDKAETDAKQLRSDNDAVKAELKVCAKEWRVVRDKLESVIEDKARLEKEVSDLEAQYDACLVARKDAEEERDRFCSENEAIKVERTSFRDKVKDLTDRLNHALDTKRELEERMAESEREWRDACVQASALIQSPDGPKVQNPAVLVNSATSPFPVDSSPSPIATRAAHVQTDTWTTPGPVGAREPVGTIDAMDDAVASTVQSPSPVEASTANDVVNDMKAILSQIQSSLSASQAEAEQSKLKSRLDAEKEVESLRISLETAEEHIVRLKTQIPAFHKEQGSCGGPSVDSAFDERILRIKEARERATLACAYQERLAEITSPERREGATTNAGQPNNHRQLSDLSNNINTRQEDSSVRRKETLKKSLAELRSLRKQDEERRTKASGSKLCTSQQQRPLRTELAGSGSVHGQSSQQQPVYLLSPLPVSTINGAAASDAAASSGMISPLPIDASMTTAQQLGITSVEDIIDILESCS